MPTILSCTDGSAYAPSVYDHSAWAAGRMNASVHVLHMLDPRRERASIATFSGHLGLDDRDQLLHELVELEETQARVAQARGRVLLRAAQDHLQKSGVKDITTEQRHGSLVEAMEEAKADLIVIGKRGESAGFAKLHLGANLERVIRTSQQPVLVSSRAFAPVEQMLIAFDGSPTAKKIIDYACQKPLLQKLTCHLLTVGKTTESIAESHDNARTQLTQAGYTVISKTLPGEPDKVIPGVLEEEKIQLLVMGAYGHNRIRRLIVGSTTTTMVRTCHVPILMFR